MKIIKFTLILVLALIFSQCISTKKSIPNQQNLIMTKKGFTKAVIVDRTGLDGCSFLIQASDSVIYEPINMEEKYKKDGLQIYIKFKRSRIATTCMNGQPIIISEIAIVK
tara:strand:- start:90 stop:419 length:330 start_codon:yes stop_codon:yes gene_type:complete